LFAADLAGAIPKINPIAVATKKDNVIELIDNIVSIPVAISII
jgi:hypothetical protein